MTTRTPNQLAIFRLLSLLLLQPQRPRPVALPRTKPLTPQTQESVDP